MKLNIYIRVLLKTILNFSTTRECDKNMHACKIDTGVGHSTPQMGLSRSLSSSNLPQMGRLIDTNPIVYLLTSYILMEWNCLEIHLHEASQQAALFTAGCCILSSKDNPTEVNRIEFQRQSTTHTCYNIAHLAISQRLNICLKISIITF